MKELQFAPYTVNVEQAGVNRFDVVLHKDGTIIGQSTGCIGQQSADYWESVWVQKAQRLQLLNKMNDQLCHNLMCYSKSLLMNEPKEGYEEIWQQVNMQQKVVAKWMDEMEA